MSRILVIDDNDLVGKMLQETLHENGYDVRVALDANQGYKEAVQFLPDLIILDVRLPDLTGFDLCRVIKNKSELRNVPIIMITGSARSTEDKVKGFQMGVDDYLLKPFDMPEFLERVRAVLRRSESRRPAQVPVLSEENSAASLQAPKSPEPSPIFQSVLKAWISPDNLPAQIFVPGLSLTFLLVALGLCFGALALSSGVEFSLTLTGLSVFGLWGIAVAVLVMAGSIAGVPVSWKEGAGLISLAASPLLLKLTGALITSLWTTLSPFYFSAGPNLFWSGAPGWLARVDAFELWSVFLIWSMVSRWPGSSRRKAWTVTLLVWGAAAALAAEMGKAVS